jgi:putative transcriptional regulator
MISSLPEKMASEITLSNNPGLTIRKWREIFNISQNELASELKLSSSVISDYEHGRRRSPGVAVIQKLIKGMLSIDENRGSPIIRKYATPDNEAIIDIREFYNGKTIEEFAKQIEGEPLTFKNNLNKVIYGYTIIDSMKAILNFTSEDYLRIFGWSSDRALIFTGVKFGRSPMIAVRTHSLKPTVIVFHRPERIDPLAIKLAELENIVFIQTSIPIKELISKLRDF